MRMRRTASPRSFGTTTHQASIRGAMLPAYEELSKRSRNSPRPHLLSARGRNLRTLATVFREHPVRLDVRRPGILAATTAEPDLTVDFALGTMFAACLAIGISTGVSVYEAEYTEGEIRLRRLERAMLSRLEDSGIPGTSGYPGPRSPP